MPYLDPVMVVSTKSSLYDNPKSMGASSVGPEYPSFLI